MIHSPVPPLDAPIFGALGSDFPAKHHGLLIQAAGQGSIDSLTTLLEGGADLNAVDHEGRCAISHSAAHGQTAATQLLVKFGANVNATDQRGRTPVMLAVLGGYMKTAVQLALQGADLRLRDTSGRTVMELSIEGGHREMSLALLLICSAKFTKALRPLLPLRLLNQLQVWVADQQAKNDREKAMGTLLEQYEELLTAGKSSDTSGGGVNLTMDCLAGAQVRVPMQSTSAAHGASSGQFISSVSAEEGTLALEGLIGMLIWSARRAYAGLWEPVSQCIVKRIPLNLLCHERARDREGNSVLHALTLAGQVDACRTILSTMQRNDAEILLLRRNFEGRLVTELDTSAVAPNHQGGVLASIQILAMLARQIACAGDGGRGGAVRRRSPSNEDMLDAGGGSDASDSTSKSAAAADLLQLAASGGSVGGSSRGRGLHSASRRTNKPYNRPASACGNRRKGGDSASEWLPGGCWWQDSRTPMPPGRQPGELAGWTPLAGEVTQREMQEQKQALNLTEQRVQGLESRDQALAYLEKMQHPSAQTQVIKSAVDDSVIGVESTPFRNLAKWGGFRRHFKEGEEAEQEAPTGTDADQQLAREHELQAQYHADATRSVASSILGTNSEVPNSGLQVPLDAEGLQPAQVESERRRAEQEMARNAQEVQSLEKRLEELRNDQQRLGLFLSSLPPASAEMLVG